MENNTSHENTNVEGVDIDPNVAAAQIRAVMDEQDSSDHYARVSEMYIKDSTRTGYQLQNRTFLVWLFNKNPTCINEYALQKLRDVFTAQIGARSLEKNKSVLREAQKIIHSADETKQPIKFTEITVRIFVDFLHSRARGIDTDRNFLSKSASGSYRSAFKDLHRQCGVTMNEDFEGKLQTAYKGLQRGHAAEKQSRGGRLQEGKDPMSFALYNLLCKKMLLDGSKEAIFSHAFLTLTWNLICRSMNTVHIHRNHISWANDCMTIRFAHTKTDVEGGDQARIRHVFANPYNLAICAVTAVAKYLGSFVPKPDGMLFDDDSYRRFQKYLSKLLKLHKEEIELLGGCIEDIGVHSIRKGAATYCCGGTTAAPHIAAICNRAGWTMGKVKDTYIQYAEAGDQHVGRVVAGLPVLNARYACSPPFFCIDDTEDPKPNTCRTIDVAHSLDEFFPLLIKDSPSLKPVATYCAAAICFAYKYFKKVMPTTYVY